jgi:hypothetical protein
MQEGDTKTISGLQVYLQDVFVSNVGGESASAKLFIGSKELNLGPADEAAWNTVEIDGEEVEGVEVNISGGEDTCDLIRFQVDATAILNEELDEDFDWLAIGDTFVDPLFSFELKFVEAVPSLESSSRDMLTINSASDEVEITFTAEDGTEYTIVPYVGLDDADGNLTWQEDFVVGTALVDDSIFMLYEDAGSSEPVTKVYQFTGTKDSDTVAVFKTLQAEL